MTHAGGRPPLYNTVEELQKVIDEYFDWCDDRLVQGWNDKTNTQFAYIKPAPYTMSGLARRLGMSRQALSEYSHKDEFGDAIMRARDKVQEDIENRLMETRNEKGAMFNLTNNFGWRTKNETDITSGGQPLKTNTIVFSDFKDETTSK